MPDWTQYDQKFYQEPDDILLQENNWFESIVRNLNIKGKLCVDFGCGSGNWIELFADCEAEVIGVDISPEAIEHCQNLYPTNTFYLIKDKLPLEDNSVDFVIATWVVQEIFDHGELRNYLHEIARILKTGGYFLVVNNVYPDSDSRALVEQTDMGDIFTNFEDTPPLLRFFPGNSMKTFIAFFGFEHCSYSAIGWSYCELYRKI